MIIGSYQNISSLRRSFIPAFTGAAFFLFLLLIVSSCRKDTSEKENRKTDDRQLYEEMLKVNQYLVKRNQELVENFNRRTGWGMKNTGTGLWYVIVNEGNGEKAEEGDQAVIRYKIRLLDGTEVTTNPEWITRSFTIGKGSMVAGVEEGVQYMHEGGYARFVIPPHLAYGNFGELQKIPPGSILLYDVKLLDLN